MCCPVEPERGNVSGLAVVRKWISIFTPRGTWIRVRLVTWCQEVGKFRIGPAYSIKKVSPNCFQSAEFNCDRQETIDKKIKRQNWTAWPGTDLKTLLDPDYKIGLWTSCLSVGLRQPQNSSFQKKKKEKLNAKKGSKYQLQNRYALQKIFNFIEQFSKL